MAIRRCPYCRAIIDEKDQYCNNCGTQLLFPEDELIEEDIPGEKLTHQDVDEEENEDLKTEDEYLIDEGDEEEPGGSGPEEEKEATSEVSEEKTKEPEELTEDVELKTDDDLEEEEIDEEEVKIVEEPEVEKEEEETEEIPIAKEELTFKTEDLDRMGPTVEQAKEEIDRYLESLKEKSQVKEEKRPSEPKEKIPSLTGVLEKEVLDTGDGLPPWANKIKEPSPPSEILEIEEDHRERTAGDEKNLFDTDTDKAWSRERTTDSGIGIPERVTRSLTQESLPFEQGVPMKTETEEEDERELEESEDFEPEPEEEEEVEGAVPAVMDLSSKLKARAFDVLFVTAIWLISIWLASRSMMVNLFSLISASAVPVLVFYGILLVAYFFLFLFFLGETLGDRLFLAKD
jgi:hypothetical protein